MKVLEFLETDITNITSGDGANCINIFFSINENNRKYMNDLCKALQITRNQLLHDEKLANLRGKITLTIEPSKSLNEILEKQKSKIEDIKKLL